MTNKPEKYYTNLRTDTIRDIRATDAEAVLEIGGGEFGTLSAIADMFGAKAVGMDIVDICENPKVEVIQGSLNKRKIFEELGDQRFDIIVANDVLEHLSDPQMVLNELFRVSRSGAYLHVSVPNIRQVRALYHIFFRGTFMRRDSGLFDRTHVNWFCLADISKMIEVAGFKIDCAYMKGRFVPSFLRSGLIAQLLGLQSIIIARRP